MYVIFLHATTHEGLQFMDNRAFVECTESYSGGSPICLVVMLSHA